MSTLLNPLLATCRHGCNFELPCSSATEKQRREDAHNQRHHPSVEAVTDLVANDPSHSAERAEIEAAIEMDGAAHQGEVDPNRVRRLLPLHIQPQLVGAIYSAWLREGRLKQRGWTTNEDRRGRNVGKPLMTYDLVDGA